MVGRAASSYMAAGAETYEAALSVGSNAYWHSRPAGSRTAYTAFAAVPIRRK